MTTFITTSPSLHGSFVVTVAGEGILPGDQVSDFEVAGGDIRDIMRSSAETLTAWSAFSDSYGIFLRDSSYELECLKYLRGAYLSSVSLTKCLLQSLRSEDVTTINDYYYQWIDRIIQNHLTSRLGIIIRSYGLDIP